MTMKIHCDRCGRCARRDDVKGNEYRTLSVSFSGALRVTFDLCETCVEAIGDPVPAILEAMRLPPVPATPAEPATPEVPS